MNTDREKVVRGWTRIGAGIGSRPVRETPDLERLLLDTARVAPIEPRLVPVILSWLCRYYELVAKHRLAKLVVTELEPEVRPVLGLLLDIVRDQIDTGHFNDAIDLCKPVSQPRPLYEFQIASAGLCRIAERRASVISKKWGLWIEDFEPKFDAIRPIEWVLARNPSFNLRERFEGDLRASIVETLRTDPPAGRSELELCRRCLASRDALRKALDRLERYGYVERLHVGRAISIRLAA